MNRYLEVLAASTATFAVTNIDDALLLTLFFAKRIPARRIVAGQYLGFAIILLISLIGAAAALAIPHRWIRFLGVVPLAIGARLFLQAFRSKSNQLRADNLSVASIALLTFSNGADNVGVYVPFFVVARRPSLVDPDGVWDACRRVVFCRPLARYPFIYFSLRRSMGRPSCASGFHLARNVHPHFCMTGV